MVEGIQQGKAKIDAGQKSDWRSKKEKQRTGRKHTKGNKVGRRDGQREERDRGREGWLGCSGGIRKEEGDRGTEKMHGETQKWGSREDKEGEGKLRHTKQEERERILVPG